jgi:sec-independent protein translocase protein TatC
VSEQPPNEADAHRMPLMEHLFELRRRLIIAAIALLIGVVVCLWISEDIIDILSAPVRLVLKNEEPSGLIDQMYMELTSPIMSAIGGRKAPGNLTVIGSLEGMYTYLRVSLLGGAVLTSPILAYQIWAFIAPGLYKSERRYILPLAAASSFLFTLGAAFAYVVILPVAFSLFMTILDVEVNLSIDDAIKTVVRILLAFGICYQLPVVAWFLARIGLIDHKDMIRGFRYAVVGIFAIAALITPPDILTQVLLGIPLVILYGVGIVVARISSTKVRD